MSKKTIVTILGSVVIVLPFIGLPNSISTPIFVVAGVGIIYIARVGKRKVENYK
jgi:hypothetical protein